MTQNDSLTAVAGIRVGHWTAAGGRSGCTVVLAPPGGCAASGRVLGGAPASRETDLLDPERMMPRVDAIVLSGGSAFGLASAHGVMEWLAERGRGFTTRAGPVPIVPTACIYDLEIGSERPDARAGRAAADAAGDDPVAGGRVGVGAGATVGAYLGYDRAVRTGVGSSAVRFEGRVVAALAVSNAAGDIYDPASGRLVAGHGATPLEIASLLLGYDSRANTTLVVVATDALVDKAALASLSIAAHAGIARVTRPSHTPFDGDTVFALSTGAAAPLPAGALAVLVQEAVTEAVLASARNAAMPA